MKLPPLLALTLILPLLRESARAADAPRLPGIGEQMEACVLADEISGAVTLVETRDRPIHLEATGYANLANREPMRTDSIFWIKSMTKPITGAAVLMLQDEGKLRLSDPVAKYIPAFANLKTPSGQPANLTIEHLLTHTSGLGEGGTRGARTLADLIPGFLASPMQFEPGTRWKYCQSGINTAARIVEIVSGQSYDEFLAARLFRPLGMKDTSFYPTAEQLPRVVTVYEKNPDTGKIQVSRAGLPAEHVPALHARPPTGNDGLYSTAADYARFCRMLLNGGTLDGKQYLRPETVKLMASIHTGALKTGFTPGFGWGIGCGVVREPQDVTAMFSPGTFGHGGQFGTQAWMDPQRGVAFILMVQRSNFYRNADDNDVRKNFQQAAANALASQP